MDSYTVRVALLRDLPEEGRVSMERFGDELARSLGGHSGIDASAIAVPAGRDGRLVAKLRRFIAYPLVARSSTADVYHIVDHSYADLALALPIERTIVTCHDLLLLRAAAGGAGFRGRRLTTARFRWSTAFLRRVARVVCDSEATRTDVIRLCGVDPGRATVVSLGVSPSFRPLEVDRHCVLPDVGRFALLHVSTGGAHKNVLSTLRVTASLRSSGFDATLVRVGKPLGFAEMEAVRRLGLDGHVCELGRVPDEHLVEIYNACDALLFPSSWEGFGWPVLEAMACGLPVVTSTCAALVELASGAALHARSDDVGGLARNIASVLESPQLATELRARGLVRAALFTWDRTAAAYAAVYHDVHERARAARHARHDLSIDSAYDQPLLDEPRR